MTTEPRGARVRGGRRWLRGLAAGLTAAAVGTAPPAHAQPAKKPTPATPAPAAETRVVAYIYGGTPVTRDELGEYLIARGGMEKVELLVNKRVIEIEAARRNVSVMPQEIEAGLGDDLRGVGTGGVSKEEFVQFIQSRYGKTLFEWEVDVIRPRLLLGKMCRDRVKVSDDELRKLFENRYGERREAQIVKWPKAPGAPALSAEVRAAARANPVEFEKLASNQPDPDLAKARGLALPVGRHIDGEDPRAEAALFALPPNGISDWVETPTHWVCFRLLKVIPPDPAATAEKARGELEKDLIDKKVSAEIPALFAELKKQANPTLTVHVPAPPQPVVPAGTTPPPPANRAPEPDPRVLARVYTQPVTREDLGEFLIARGGYEKLEFLVNRKIIETEARKRGVGVTPEDIEAGLAEYLRGLPPGANNQPITKDDFVRHILPRYKKTLWEWTEDVIKPELLLRRMCRDRVKVTEEDLRQAFENRFGEKRWAQLIIWPKEQFRQAQKEWAALYTRTKAAGEDEQKWQAERQRAADEFDRVARSQANPDLASATGRVSAMGRYTDADNPAVERELFRLQPGEVSGLIDTPAGIMCVKCVRVDPPTPAVTLPTVREALHKEVYERKLTKEVPALFAELKREAAPNILLKSAPTAKENAEGVRQMVNEVLRPGK